MRRFFLCGLAAATAVALAAPPAQALRIALPVAASTKTKTMQADAVVVGKVTGIEKETVDLEMAPGSGKVPHTVANIKIETSLYGAKNVTHLKLAFVKPGDEGQPGDVNPGRPIKPLPFPGPGGRGGQQYIPTEDQEGIFFLQKHPTSDKHFVVQFGHAPVLASDAKYADELATVKAMTAAYADPLKALKAEKVEDRVTGALALAQKYRGQPANNLSGVLEETPVPAEESRLFLQVLADADWGKNADAARLADALGLIPGNYGIPVVLPGDSDDPLAARQKAFKAWAEKYGAKFEVKKVSAKPMPAQKNPGEPGGRPVRPVPGGGIRGGGNVGGPVILPAIPPVDRK